jgi:uncharacterized protein YegJ (DUF2314 family)
MLSCAAGKLFAQTSINWNEPKEISMAAQFRILIAASAVVFLLSTGAQAGNLAGVHNVPTDDPAMAEAERKAAASLDGFLEKLANPPAGTEYYSVKVGIVDDGNGFRLTNDPNLRVEYFWLTDVAKTADGFIAKIGNEPEVVRNIVAGQQIAFKKSDIFDWMYFENGRMKGNYSACPALLAGPKEDLEQFKQQYGIECE